MEKKIQQLIIQLLKDNGYEVEIEPDGIYADEEDTSTGVKISIEIIP